VILRFFFQKEARKHPFFFLILAFTLFLGTFGLTGISLVNYQVQKELSDNARSLLTSDISVSARRELSRDEQRSLKAFMDGKSKDSYELIDLYSMIFHEKSGQSRLTEIRFVEDSFPFYGDLELSKGVFVPGKGLYISKELASLWEISPGDLISIGSLKVPVEGIVTKDSSQGLRGFSLAPRAYFPLSRIKETGLLSKGTTGSFSRHFKIKENLNGEDLKSSLKKLLADAALRISLPEDMSEQTGRTIRIITNFMSLSALIGLVLALVGVFYLYQSHLLSRMKDLAILHLHGLQKSSLIGGVVLQFSLIFFAVYILQFYVLIPLFYRSSLPFLSEEIGLTLPEAMDFTVIARLFPLLFILGLSIIVPLLMGLLRTPMGEVLKSSRVLMGRFRWYDFLPFLLVLWLASYRLSQNVLTGSLFFGCLFIVFLFSTGVILLVQRIVKSLIQGRGLLNPGVEMGLALRGILRSGHKLVLSFLSLCMGATLITLILQLDHKIGQELSLSGTRPGLFLFDIQEEQLEDFTAFAQKMGTPLEAVTPVIRARLEKVNGKPFRKKKNPFLMSDREDDDLSREKDNALNLTYRGYLTSSEKIIEGKWFEGPPGDLARVSLEKRWADRMGLTVGDKLEFDVQGVPVEGIVANIKEIKWTSFYPNFFVSLEPGFLEPAPKTYLAVLPPVPLEKKNAFQRGAVKKFPNISAIDVEELTGKLATLFSRSRKAIEIISWLSLGIGLIILYGLSHDQVYRRSFDLALLKSLGLTPNRLRLQLVLEFGSLFILSLSLGFFLGWAMANLLGQEIMRLPWSTDGKIMLIPGLILVVLCLLTILVSSWRAVRLRPRQLLADT
jgi:putative ABC transport system permease protein